MKNKRFAMLVAGGLALMLLSWPAISSAKDKDEKEVDRIKNAAAVLKEILDIPDDIPQDLLDKARCVIVFPSVVKAAFIVGGSYGRGVMVCRSGKDFSGPWGAPAMMALEFWFADWRPSDRLRDLGNECPRSGERASQQSEARS